MAAAEAKRMKPADVLTPRDFEYPPVRSHATLFEYGRHCDLYSNSLKASTQAAGVQVLVKMQKPKLRRCPDGKHILDNEIEILRNLPAHPNIVQFMGYVNRDGPKALVVRFSRRDTCLRDCLGYFPFTIGETWSIIRDVAEAMAFLHAHDVVYRDLKCSNVYLLEKSNRAVLCDFGTAVLVKDNVLPGTSFLLPHTPPSQSTPPEVWQNGIYGMAGDVYAFGCCIREIFNANPLWLRYMPDGLGLKALMDQARSKQASDRLTFAEILAVAERPLSTPAEAHTYLQEAMEVARSNAEGLRARRDDAIKLARERRGPPKLGEGAV
jgi:serine/threonine protein kinase